MSAEPWPVATATPGSRPPLATPTPTASLGAGMLDPSFGSGGLVLVPFGGMVGVARGALFVGADGGTSVLAFDLDDGGLTSEMVRIVVSPGGDEVEIVRPLTSMRALDAAFADDGSAIVLGERLDGNGEVAVARLTAEGVLDPSYGKDGFAATRVGSATGVVALAGGGAVVLGDRDGEPILLRLTAAGSIDRAFGRDGVASLPAPVEPEAGTFVLGDLAATSDGSLIAAVTYTVGLTPQAQLIAFTPEGKIDVAFGDRGTVAPETPWRSTTPLLVGRDGGIRWLLEHRVLSLSAVGEMLGTVAHNPEASFDDLRQTASGGLVLAGSAWVEDQPQRFGCENGSPDRCLRRAVAVQSIAADGTPDAAFGDGGTAVTDLPAPYGAQDTGGRAVATAPVGRLTVAAIACQRPFACDLVVLRYGAP